MFDAQRVKQVLLNLLSNAMKFTSFGSVTVVVDFSRGMLQFKVQDTGVGISASE